MEHVDSLLLSILNRITCYGHGVVYLNNHSPMDTRLFPLGKYSKEAARNTCVQAVFVVVVFGFLRQDFFM